MTAKIDNIRVFNFHRALDKKEIGLLYINGMDKNSILRNLIKAARPFISDDIVDEMDATIPLMEKLEEAIEVAELFLEGESDIHLTQVTRHLPK